MAAWQRGAERFVGSWPERAGKGRLHQIREFPTARAAERKLLCCWIIMRSRMGAGGGCGGVVRVSASRNQVHLHGQFGQCR